MIFSFLIYTLNCLFSVFLSSVALGVKAYKVASQSTDISLASTMGQALLKQNRIKLNEFCQTLC